VPAGAQVQPEAVVSLLLHRVVAEVRLAAEALAVAAPAEAADRHRHAVGQPAGSGPGQPPGQAALQQLLQTPEVGGLAGEGGALGAAQAGEVGGVVLPEVPEQAGIAVEPEVLADEFDGDDLAVGQGRVGTALARAAGAKGLSIRRPRGRRAGAGVPAGAWRFLRINRGCYR
jgi:hypothetical protein